jgi:hypothetical protein
MENEDKPENIVIAPEGQEYSGRNLEEAIRDTRVELLDSSVVNAYVDDLKSLLSKGSIVEQKSFLRSFVKRIEVNLPQVAIDYTIPLEMKKVEPLTREVLPFAYAGSPKMQKLGTGKSLLSFEPLLKISELIYTNTKLKRKIIFTVTIGSRWIEDNKFPVGGTVEFIELEFETDNKNPMHDAELELSQQLLGKSYHIWYWDWLN